MEVINRICENCVRRKTLYCPNSKLCYDILYLPYFQDRVMLLKENEELKKQVEKRKYYKFYKYENNPYGSDHCFCERPCNSNMSLKCFFENGEICGFMSESLVDNHAKIEEISLNGFAHDFIKPLINAYFQNKNQQKEFIKYLENKIKEIENNREHLVVDMFGSYDLNELDLNILKEILQKYKSIIGGNDV